MTANKTAAPVRISEFMDRDFKLFSLYDNLRSIPYLTDGFKPSQRKAVCGMLMRGENAPEIKVSQLTGTVSASTSYHHGEGSLSQTIIGMAQDYAGSNNMNYFVPNGQFGNRLCAEAAADRYIFTQLSPNFRKIFKKEDDFILEPQYDDGDEIEPVTYLPVLPNVLINGSRGMGTGYACHILNYNPEDLRLAIIAELQSKKWEPLVPWYRGFQGKVYRNVTNEINPNQVVFEGVLEVVNSTTIKISCPILIVIEFNSFHDSISHQHSIFTVAFTITKDPLLEIQITSHTDLHSKEFIQVTSHTSIFID